MADISELRKRIDEVDHRIVEAVAERMDISADIARYKKDKGLPSLDTLREREKLAEISEMASEELRPYYQVLYTLLFELSRSYQNLINNANSEKFDMISRAMDETPKLFPRSARVACQGVEGAYSTIAAEKIFKMPNIKYYDGFGDVFTAVERGECEYGVLPIENSTAGSVKKVYDLMINRHFYIVRAARVKVNHSLVAKTGTELKDVREIISHEQALSQCSEYLRLRCPTVKITEVANTALAAQMVMESERGDLAAISSYRCAELYGLKTLDSNIADNGNNHTRFICISRKPEIYPGADKTTLMLVASHRPGSLYRILARFYALGINISKLESRPIAEQDFEFTFYFDLEGSVYAEEFVRMICDIDDCCEVFQYLGSYSELP